jgi:hypothetical protein
LRDLSAEWIGARLRRVQRKALRGALTRRRHFQRAGELAHHHLGQADATAGHALRQLLVEHRGVHAGLLAVEHAVLRGGLAHAFHQHVHEHRLELLRRLLQRLGRSVLGIEPELVDALDVERKFR